MDTQLGGKQTPVELNDSEEYSATTSKLGAELKNDTKPLAAIGLLIQKSGHGKWRKMSRQSMRNAAFGPTKVNASPLGTLSTFCDSGNDATIFLVIVTLPALGLWTFMSVLYSPGTRPIDSARFVSRGRPTKKGLAILQIHFAVYMNAGGVDGAGLASEGLRSNSVNVEPSIVDTIMALRRTTLSFFIF